MRIIGMMAVYNESDIVGQTIAHMISQGVPLVVLDNGSTDGSYEVESEHLRKGVLSLERLVTKKYKWDLVLQTLYKMALKHNPEWVVRCDADEFLESPYGELTLKEAIEREAHNGYNLIQFNNFEFWPTEKDEHSKEKDVKKRLKYYSWHDDFQFRAWKVYPGMAVDQYGGHLPSFPKKRRMIVSPNKFVLRHYRIRSLEHGTRKVFDERLPRYDSDEKRRGWHTHYRNFKNDRRYFVIDSRKLTRYDEDRKWDMLLNYDGTLGAWPGGSVTARTFAVEREFNEATQWTHKLERELRSKIRSITKQLEESRSTIEAMNAERSQLTRNLDQFKKQLDDIHHSLGYKFMRSYASSIDRLLPDGTYRGEFRKRVTASLRIITEQGTHRESISDEDLMRNPGAFLSTRESTLEFPAYADPIVSIVVVAYEKAYYTFQCLRSLLSDTLPSYEVIVVDNASTDETQLLLSKTRNVTVIANKRNQFFPRACNQGATAARGKYLLFLNNDAFVHAGCVQWLTRTLESMPDVGAAGAKLLGRDGRLLEAGSIVWRDGSALGYGRGDDASKPEYCYTRDVDYCSAACLIVRRDLFRRLAGFDEAFTPAYYEDTDLCARIWSAGFRVVYQPMAVATHVEFAGSSFESATELMEKQRVTFLSKHKNMLEGKLPFSERNIIRSRDRKESPAILVVDDCVPRPEDGSGYPRMFLMLKSMASLGYRVTLMPMTDATPKQPETGALTQMGIEVLWGGAGADDTLQLRRDSYDIVVISRPHNALLVMNLVRETNPKARVVYDAEALWYRRQKLATRLGLPADPRFKSQRTELSIMRRADYIFSVSSSEKKLIEEKLGRKRKVILIGHPHTVSPTETTFEERRDILFLGGFKSSPGPNDDAAIYFATTIFPRVREQIPGVRFVIAGSNAPESVKQLASNSILVVGYVKDLKQIYASARVFVAPIRFAAGAMWKVTEAMSYGLPSVLSGVSAEGVGAKDGEEALVARDENDFVKKTVRLYRDEELWNRVRERGLQYVTKTCDPVAIEERLNYFLKQVSGDRARASE